MPDYGLLKKFVKAAIKISSKAPASSECVYGAYVGHLSDIDIDGLPERIQIIYESVKLRLTATLPPGKISEYETNRIAKDILYIANVIRIVV